MPRITELFAFVVEDKGPDDEGVIGVRAPNGEWLPFVGADPARVAQLTPLAQEVANRMGKPIRILRFTAREETGMIQPATAPLPDCTCALGLFPCRVHGWRMAD